MEFKGGSIIIGSLLWDKAPKRIKWRKLYLQDLENKIPVKVKICYGRKSSSRKDTYTMVFSNHPKIEFGNAYILPFIELIKNAKQLESQAFAMASAEGLWKKEKPSLNKSWGTVGLLINPKLKNSRNLEIIKERWSHIYSEYDLKPSKYIIDKEPSIINENGFLSLDWTDEMENFDFLIATLTEPNKSLPKAKEIAERMNEKGYNEYFLNNNKYGIYTFQDEEIIKYLK